MARSRKSDDEYAAPVPRVARTGAYRPRPRSRPAPETDAALATQTPPEDPDTEDPRERPMTIGDHLEELRRRVIMILVVAGSATVVAIFLSTDIHSFLVSPYLKLTSSQLLLQNVYGGMEVLLKVAAAAGLTLTFPILIYILWGFVTPAVSRRTALIGHIIVASSATLFWIGVAFCWIYVFPLSLQFLFIDLLPPGVSPQTSVEKYYAFLFLLHMGAGVSFQLPLLLILLGAMGVVTIAAHRRIWRYVIVGIFIFSGAITPPDWVSQVAFGGVLTSLYVISVAVVAVIEFLRHRRERDELVES